MASDEGMCTTWKCDSLSVLITIAQLGQIVPQHMELATSRSVVGVSPWLVFFAALYTHLAAIDLVISSRELFRCGSGGIYRCFIDTQPLVQMMGSAVLSAGLWFWYLKFADTYNTTTSMPLLETQLSVGEIEAAIPSRDCGRFFFEAYLWLAGMSTLAALCVVHFYGADSDITRVFSASCGLASAALNGIMWLPQIYVTWKYKHKGALSVLWVICSIVMDVVYSVYLAKLGVNFSVWANNIPDAIQTGVLLALVTYFEYQDEKAGKDNFGHRIDIDMLPTCSCQTEDEEEEERLLHDKIWSLKDSEYGSIIAADYHRERSYGRT